MRYCGTWDAATEYLPGDFVTHDGSVRHCHVATKGTKPGDSRGFN